MISRKVQVAVLKAAILLLGGALTGVIASFIDDIYGVVGVIIVGSIVINIIASYIK